MTTRGLVVTFLAHLFGMMPLRLNHAIGSGAGKMLARFPNRQLRVARRNIEICFPELDPDERERLVREAMLAVGRGAVELGFFWTRSPEHCLGMVREIHGADCLDRAIAAGRGILLAAPHLGAWELLCQYLASRTECAILYQQPEDAGVEAAITRGRSRGGADMVRADSRGVRRIFRAAKEGKLIGILPDHQPKRGEGEFAPFFGIEAFTMVLLSRLAQRTGCPVVFGWAERLPRGKGFDLHFADGDDEIGGDDIRASLTALNAGVEGCARQCLAQYQWGYKRFTLRPDGEKPIYASRSRKGG